MQNPESPSIPVPTSAPAADPLRTSVYLPPLLPGVEHGPQLPSALSAPPTAFTLWRAFLRRWPLALGGGLLLGTLAVAAVFTFLPPRYPAQVWFKINAARAIGPISNTAEDAEFQILKSFQSVL